MSCTCRHLDEEFSISVFFHAVVFGVKFLQRSKVTGMAVRVLQDHWHDTKSMSTVPEVRVLGQSIYTGQLANRD